MRCRGFKSPQRMFFFLQIYGPFEFLEFINRGENVLKKMKAMIFAKKLKNYE